ncbi:MAG TPA: MFS transporter [Candidatus Limnocylindrales bacterium]|nr:MFS transporter [Candidatus Limnocylindrales bacterium]
MSFSQRLQEVRTGFERPFWVANVTELFERLSYYAAFAVIVRYLHENLRFSTTEAGTLAGQFGTWVWILAIFGGTIADRLGFRRALSLAYLILTAAYFLMGSLGANWLAPVRNAVPLTLFVTIIMVLPALGIAMVKPCVVGTTARASQENVRSIGYSIYYTLVNIGGAAGPLTASWVQGHMSVENVFRVAAFSVFIMFFAVLLLFKEPKKTDEVQVTSIGQTIRNFGTVVSNPRFMLFLLIFSGYWIVYWQIFLSLPLYIHDYVNPNTDTARMLSTGPILVIALTVAISVALRKMRAFRAVTLGTLISALAWVVLIVYPSVPGGYLTLAVVALGEIILSPRYYEYVSLLAPSGQQGTYMGFAFLPIGIGAFIGGPLGGALLHHFGEVQHKPALFWWCFTGIGVLTAVLLWIYDRIFKPTGNDSKASAA